MWADYQQQFAGDATDPMSVNFVIPTLMTSAYEDPWIDNMVRYYFHFEPLSCLTLPGASGR